MAGANNIVFESDQIVELIKTLVWPITTIIMALAFRVKLASALDGFLKKNNVTEFSTSGFTAKFSQTITPSELQGDNKSVEISVDYHSVIKYQTENKSKYTCSLLKNYRLYRCSYNISDLEALEMVETALAITISHNMYAGINRVIYKSQLFFLEHIHSQRPNKVTTPDLVNYFSSVQLSTPLLTNITASQYVSYLIGALLMKITADIYELTDFGESYVEYMRNYPNLVGHLDQS
ncbi:MAG: hypothetical protein H9917_00210 [Candidatus Oceanisphaera merdipullorum]|nr:hypothetical protein [Candidatus Oceanisphaera merdipullorum]